MGLKNPVIWLVLIGIVIVLFGASKLPDITRNVGKSLKIFKQEVRELKDDTNVNTGTTGSTAATPPVVEGTASAPSPQAAPAQPEQPPAAPHPSTPPADTNR
ncbi:MULTISPECIES: twin-arginine translocase TatA/TatE family subunit [unclassified Pseudactinotalea]|uniref:twin-arginine translocase TatA/TatE family subunit n=1 Tax=unclassified Pseudactinotalea TaxID=2649176 RepID=UPI00128C1E1E|nr:MULTISPECIES: twin-arginine translocase TatA/TatE family subunit [unclassified Pseudactinotalea]MPV49310.1 twin-arginine translocase TatA/TatE family subunit [Pseudactinotalea sp. HY160]QGH69395.1 twin-arginine translocase TatA/TatE family subunit [Pseudactinotalea sp. HY158]